MDVLVASPRATETSPVVQMEGEDTSGSTEERIEGLKERVEEIDKRQSPWTVPFCRREVKGEQDVETLCCGLTEYNPSSV